MKKLRLLITEKCNRTCKSCCNKDWDLKNLPICSSFKGYNEIILTGGEPALVDLYSFLNIIDKIKKHNSKARIIVYSADWIILKMLPFIDGLTFTLHEQEDIKDFMFLNKALTKDDRKKSLRLNIFKNVKMPTEIDLTCWNVKDNMEWMKNCPLPQEEIFMKLKEG